MSEIGDLIKQIAKNEIVNTFPAVVVDRGVDKSNEEYKYTISVRKLIPKNKEEEYKKLQLDLDSTYVTEEMKKWKREEMKKGRREEKSSPNSDIIYNKVRLKSVVNGLEEGIIVIPRIGSYVLISSIGTENTERYVSQYSEIDRVIFHMNNMKETNGGEKKPTDFFDIDINTKTMDIKYGELFHTKMSKEELKVDFLYPQEEGKEDSSRKVQSQLLFAKNQLKVSFKDQEEKETFTTILSKDSASVQTGDGTKKIVISNNEGIQLISDTTINIKGKTVNIEGTDAINLN